MICIVKNIGCVGNIVWVIIFLVIGYFFIKIVMIVDFDDIRGFDGVFVEFVWQLYGKMILFILVFGLILYGLYVIMKGIYQYMIWEK